MFQKFRTLFFYIRKYQKSICFFIKAPIRVERKGLSSCGRIATCVTHYSKKMLPSYTPKSMQTFKGGFDSSGVSRVTETEHPKSPTIASIIHWGQPITRLIERAEILIQTKNPNNRPVSLLLEGPSGSGKSALAAHLAEISKSSFVGVCSPDDIVLMSKQEKYHHIDRMFKQAHRSEQSCIILDDIERLIGYFGGEFCCLHNVLQCLQWSLNTSPPHPCRLLIVGTTSRKETLRKVGLLPAFKKCFHVPNLSIMAELKVVLENAKCFQEGEIKTISESIAERRLSIGIKELLALIERTKSMKNYLIDEKQRTNLFVSQLEDDGLVF